MLIFKIKGHLTISLYLKDHQIQMFWKFKWFYTRINGFSFWNNFNRIYSGDFESHQFPVYIFMELACFYNNWPVFGHGGSGIDNDINNFMWFFLNVFNIFGYSFICRKIDIICKKSFEQWIENWQFQQNL